MHFELQHLEFVHTVFNFKTDLHVLRALSLCKNCFIRHLLAFVFPQFLEKSHMRLILYQSFETEGFRSVEQLNGGVAAVVVSTLI